VCDGTFVTFTVVAGGAAPLSYQWRKGGSDIPGATSDSFTISPVTTADAGSYLVVVSNACGSVFSSSATLEVSGAPTILEQPSSQDTCEGTEVMLQVVAQGTGTLSYQWRKNGIDVSGATFSALIFNPVYTTDAGSYDVVVADDCGQVTSDVAILTV